MLFLGISEPLKQGIARNLCEISYSHEIWSCVWSGVSSAACAYWKER